MVIISDDSQQNNTFELELKISQINKKLIRYSNAVLARETSAIHEMLQEDPDLIRYRFPQKKYKTAFHIAAKFADQKMFEMLIALEPEGIKFIDKKKCTPLFNAIKTNDIEFVGYLLNKKQCNLGTPFSASYNISHMQIHSLDRRTL